tara:strand:+ start:5751 stop:6164 length:414 start_codon:yes stop_codon:yes gene_type:complete
MKNVTRLIFGMVISLAFASCDDLVTVSTQDYEGVYQGPSELWVDSDTNTTSMPGFLITVTSINADQNEPYSFYFSTGQLVEIDNGVDGYYAGTHNDPTLWGDINYEIQFNSDGTLVASCNWFAGGSIGGIQTGILTK